MSNRIAICVVSIASLFIAPASGNDTAVKLWDIVDTKSAQSADAQDSASSEPGAKPLDETFMNRKSTALVLFKADWCSPCKTVAAYLAEAALASDILVIEVDVDANPKLASSFAIQSIPTVALFSKGVPIDRKTGNLPRAEIRALAERAKIVRDDRRPDTQSPSPQAPEPSPATPNNHAIRGRP